MKRLLLSMALLATANFTFAQFTADNLIVLRTQNVTDYTALALVNIIEMDTSGEQIGSVTPIGSNNFYISHSASTLNDGALSLSTDGKLLTIYGYGELPAAKGSTDIQGNTNVRTLAIIKSDAAQQLINTSGIFAPTAVRTAIAFPRTGGTYGVYLGGGSISGQTTSQLQFGILDTIANTIGSFTRINGYNTKGIRIFNNQLYASSSAATNKIVKIGSGLPETNASAVSLTNYPAYPGDFVLFGNNILYIADDGYSGSVGGLHKYYSADGGTTWAYVGKINSGIASDDANFRFMTGRYESGKATLYAVTNKSTGNSIVKIIDNSTNDKFDNVTQNIISTAPATTGYRGISFTPNSTITLPVTLNSFTAKAVNSNVLINWSTVSEQNNKHFEILHSTDGISFSKIGEVNGKNNSSTLTQYTFTDYSPASGTNYYQLKQVDFNGKSETFGPIPVKLNFTPKENIKIINKNGSVILSINSEFTDSVNLTVTDVTGRVILSKKSVINKGDNNITLNTVLKQDAIYVLNLEGKNLNKVVKFRN